MLHKIFYIIAAVCFVAAAINWPKPSISLGWLGLFFWVLTYLI